ncbi:MAG: hypothetical protein NVS3B3_11230 [Aquirhabdus sp.]
MIQEEKKSGFVAGTLVHTDKGLVPIEQIKVGDMVLSKPENEAEGKLVYQPITETHQFQNKTLLFLRIGVNKDDADQTSVSGVIASRNHLFWVINYGWKSTDLLRMGDIVSLENGLTATVFEWGVILATDTSNVGWMPSFYEIHGFHEDGILIDLRNNLINNDFSNCESNTVYGSVAMQYRFRPVEESLFYSKVYNLVIESTHTYFVGEQGFWVHSTSTNIS